MVQCSTSAAFVLAAALAWGPLWSAGEPHGQREGGVGGESVSSLGQESTWESVYTRVYGAVDSLLSRVLGAPPPGPAELDGAERGNLRRPAALPRSSEPRRLFALPPAVSPRLGRGAPEPAKTSYASHFTPHLSPRPGRNRHVEAPHLWPVVVQQADVKILERLGKFKEELQPGFHIIIPFVDRVRAQITKREQVFDIPPQRCITSDNAPILADAVVYWRVFDPQLAIYAVEDLGMAIQNLVLTQLRSEIGKLTLQETFSAREKINEVLLKDLDVATDPWGVKITRVEVRDIIPDEEILKAMELEVAAERTKRALIIRSEGERARAINEAEGEAQSRLIEANSTAEALAINGRVIGGVDKAARFQLLQAYINAQQKLATSENAKVILTSGNADDIFAKAIAYYDAAQGPGAQSASLRE